MAAPVFPGSSNPKPVFPPAAPRTPHNLPFPPNPVFTGRDTELQKLREQLQTNRAVAVTQTVAAHGLGGVGKTQLAVEYAWKHLNDYNAVLWVKADSLGALDASPAVLASVLRLPEADEQEQACQTKAVLDWLHGHKQWLLIADNVDDDMAAEAVQKPLPPSLAGHVLVTSRLSRWPVSVPYVSLDSFEPNDAALFLMSRVGKEGHNAGDETVARSLARDLGNLPLALEQAAAFIIDVKWTFDKYHEEFRQSRPALLSERSRGATDYPESIAKAWSMTLGKLSPLARALLHIAAWLAPDAIPRGIFAVDKEVRSEALAEQTTFSDLAIAKGFGRTGPVFPDPSCRKDRFGASLASGCRAGLAAEKGV